MTRFLALLCLALPLPLVAVQAQDWSGARSCLEQVPSGPTRDSAVLEPTPQCSKHYCLRLSDGTRVCACLSEPYAANTFSGLLTVTRPGRAPVTWQTAAFIWASDTTIADIDAALIDLDGSGRLWLVVATQEAPGNGFGRQLAEVTIIPPDSQGQPQTIRDEEYSSRGSWVRLQGHKNCFFLRTQWQQLDVDARRGPGMYFVGALYPFVAGAVSDSTLPIVRGRRMLGSFDLPPGAPPEPLGLLTDRRARVVPSRHAPSIHEE